MHHQDLELGDADERTEGRKRVAAVGQVVERFNVVEPVAAQLLVTGVVG
jgi:hypothetical protein